MKYTKQDVFRLKDSGKVVIFNRELESDKAEFSMFDGVSSFFYNNLIYLGRSSKIVLYENAIKGEKYYAAGCFTTEINGANKLNKIDRPDSFIPFEIHHDGYNYLWCRHLLDIPFYALPDHLDITPNSWEVECLIQDTIGSTLTERMVKIGILEPQDINSSILVKQPKSLL